jgi:MinD-like ATPase involved in chromosome partitioning or flagellar assembly
MALPPSIAPTSPIVAFTSGKGGCGKTTLAVNFANIIAEGGHKVLLVDLDLSNRGSTGLFSTWTPQAHQKLTTLRLIRDELVFQGDCREILEVKPNKLLFLPAASPDEMPWIEPNRPSLPEFVETIRARIHEVAVRCGISCIVLDCFCGIDLLTTAAAAIADDVILVNEPDIITFTGSINLLLHLFRKFEELKRKPRVHIVINRVRSNQTVPQLSQLYRGNIERIIKEPIYCYFPYHPRVFENFGRYPFVSDLLPRSLFVKKLKLLTYLLFNDNNRSLVDHAAASWSRRKIRAVYIRTLDSSAIDTQYLVLKLTNFPVLLGLWAILWFVVFRSFPISPREAWWLRLVLIPTVGTLFAATVLYGFWLAARLNLSLATFRFRLARLQEIPWERVQWFGRSFSALLAGLLMMTGVAWLAYLLGLVAMGFAGEMDFASMVKGDKAALGKSRFISLLNDPIIRQADLRMLTFDAVPLNPYQGHFDSSDSDWRMGFFDLGGRKKILVDGATFHKCPVYEEAFERGSVWKNCTFDECTLFRGGRASDDPKIQIIGSIFEGGTFRKLAGEGPIIFRESKFTGVNINVASRTKIGFVRCAFDLQHPTRLKSESSEECRLYVVPESAPGLISEGNFVKTRDETSLVQTRNKVESLESGPTEVEALPDRIARIEKLLGEARQRGLNLLRGPLPDLAELYILQNETPSFAKADLLIYELAEEAAKAHDSGSIGTALMLRLLKCIVSTPGFEAGSACQNEKNNWEQWLKNNPAALRTRWIWNAWTKYSPTASYSDAQLAAIRGVQMQATGTFAEVSKPRLLTRPSLLQNPTIERESQDQSP